MAEEGGGVDAEEFFDGRDEVHNENERLVQPRPPTYLHFRQGREQQLARRYTGLILTVFKIIFCSLGLWGHRAWNYIPRVLFVTICAAQAAYQFSSDFGCLFFDCSQKQPQEFLQTRQICYTVFSLAALLSYVIFLGCLIVSRRKDSALVSPSLSMTEDVDRTGVVLLFVCFLVHVASSAIVLSLDFIFKTYPIQANLQLTNIIATSAVIVLAHSAAINTCHVFAISSLTLGTFAEDAFRRMRDVQNGTLDDVIRIHEDLCTVVFNTVSAYSVWFVVHWFTYAAAFVVSIILMSEVMMTVKNPIPMVYVFICLLSVWSLYVFLLPCIFAARITSKCAGVYKRINCTTSNDWNEGHPFKERRNISLFVSYAKDRRCGFKVGRITFNTSLAWFSLFFGLTGFLYHVFLL